MFPVRTKGPLATLLLVGQLSLSACQSQGDAVLPNQAAVVPKRATASDWIAIDPNTWVVSPKAPQVHVAGFVDSAVTNSVVEQGLVVAFYRNTESDAVYTLPVTVEGHSISFTYYAMNDKGIISFQQGAGRPIEGEYRWIVIPKEAATGVDWTDYDAVKLALNLDD